MNLSKNKTKFLIILTIFFGFLFFSKFLFAYDEIIVHPSLTEEMAKLYNKNFENNILTNDEISRIRKGSIDEDKNIGLAARSSNHFYNPFGVKKWADNTAQADIVFEPKLIAKEWAHNSPEQAFSAGGDYSWERAIKDYAKGDEARAYEGLGHILHLIEDMAVPAHTRNDLHISFSILGYDKGEREPYEDWTRDEVGEGNLDFNWAEKLWQENKKPIAKSSLDEYFDKMAEYTNNNFFSKDTIYSYSLPRDFVMEIKEILQNGKEKKYVYIFDENNEKIRLAEIIKTINGETNKEEEKYTLLDLDKEVESSIYSDYWSHLAPKAVLTGAGVIKLFQDEAIKAKQNSLAANQSWLSKVSNNIFEGVLSNSGAAAKNGTTLGGLLGKAGIYTAASVYSIVKSSAIALYGWGKATAIAGYDTSKLLANLFYELSSSAYQSAKSLAGGYFIYIKDGAGQAPKKIYISYKTAKVEFSASAGSFFNSTFGAAAQYFYPSAKATLVFDMSNPLPDYSIEAIAKKAKLTETAQGETIDEPIYNAELTVLKNKKSVFSPGEKLILEVEIKNTGNIFWLKNRISLNIYMPETEAEKFYYSNWLTPKRLAGLQANNPLVAPGDYGFFFFTIKSPSEVGRYSFRARPVWQSGNSFNWLSDDIAVWTINVKKPEIPESKNIIEETATENQAANPTPSPALTPESSADLSPTPALLATPTPTPIIFYGGGGSSLASTPTPTPSLSPEPSVLPTPTPSPTPEVSPSPSSSIEPSISPNPAPIISPSPTPEPSVSPTPTPEISPSPLPSPSPSPVPAPIIPAVADYPVISEIRIAGETANDEFVEIYNPASSEINLNNWDLKRKTKTGNESNILHNMQGVIKPHGYFLITPRPNCGASGTEACYKGNIIGDDEYTTNSFMADNNAILLYDNAGKIIDKAGWGESADFETLAFPENPSVGQSLERKANEFSLTESMASGGIDEMLGNGRDSDDNSADFVLQSSSNPQNSSSWAEPRPLAVMNFSAASPSEDSEIINLSWTASASDSAGLAYDVRRAENEIITQADFDEAASISGAPVFTGGAEEKMEVAKSFSGVAYSSNSRRQLFFNPFILAVMMAPQNFYCFAIQVKDASGIRSEIAGACYAPP